MCYTEGAAAAAVSHSTNGSCDSDHHIPIYTAARRKNNELDSFDMSQFYFVLNIGLLYFYRTSAYCC